MFVFDMPKVVRVRHPIIALANRCLQVIILVYFLVFVMWWNKAYQRKDQAVSGVMTQIRGVTVIRMPDTHCQPVLLDPTQFLLQPIQQSGFTIVTRIADLIDQSHDTCAESFRLRDAHCRTDSDCQAGYIAGYGDHIGTEDELNEKVSEFETIGHGAFTGVCRKDEKMCEIYGWCPVLDNGDLVNKEKATVGLCPSKPSSRDCQQNFFKGNTGSINEPMLGLLNFTVFIKNSIEFPRFDIARHNILKWMDEEFLKTCTFDPNDERLKFCPNFRIGDIIDMSGGNKHYLLQFGGVVAITIDWDCDFDWSLDYCVPTYGFHRLGGDSGGKDLFEGWEIYFGTHKPQEYPQQKKSIRTLYRLNCIQFLIRVRGHAGRFNLFIFTMNLGSNLALLGMASVVCDFLLFHFTKHKERFSGAAQFRLSAIFRALTLQAPLTMTEG